MTIAVPILSNSPILEPPKRNFWMCRAQTGRFVNHFSRFRVIGLSHIDEIGNLNLNLDREDFEESIRKHFKKTDMGDGTITSHVNQTLKFIFDAQIGDLVITVTTKSVLIGKIIEDPRFDKKILTIVERKGEKERRYEMNHFLRRKVEWISTVSRAELPYGLSRGILGRQTFFSLNDYEDEIYSMLSAYVYKRGVLTTNLKIETEDEISTYQYLSLARLFLKAEFIASELPNLLNVTGDRDLDKRFEAFCASGKARSHLVAEFASPGRTSNFLKIAAGSALLIPLVMGVALGGGKLHVKSKFADTEVEVEDEGIVPKESRAKFFDMLTDESQKAIEKWLQKDTGGLQQQLQLQKPGNAEVVAKVSKK